MSYCVIYNRRFIKTTRGIIPVILKGDSSIREDDGRIAPSWNVYNQQILEKTPDQIQQWVNDAFKDHPGNDVFMWRGNMISAREVKDWFEKGCNTARTVEHYLLANPKQSMVCKVHVWPGDFKCAFRKTVNLEYCETTEALEAWIDRAKVVIEQEKASDNAAVCYMCIGFTNLKKSGCTPCATLLL